MKQTTNPLVRAGAELIRQADLEIEQAITVDLHDYGDREKGNISCSALPMAPDLHILRVGRVSIYMEPGRLRELVEVIQFELAKFDTASVADALIAGGSAEGLVA